MDVRRWIALGGTIAVIVVIIAVIQATIAPPPPSPERSPASETTTGEPASPSLYEQPSEPQAEDFVGITRWLNSPTLALDELRGKVVLVDFWTYTCINCLRTLPYLRDWNEKYAGKGLVIVGVHTPEFEFEKIESNVREAVARERVTWPVAMDNDYATWRAYQNRWWPHKFLIDQNGTVRYDHIGEGAYEETERKIQELLIEAGFDVSTIPLGGVTVDEEPGFTTRELYAGLAWSSGGYLGNTASSSDGAVLAFSDPGQHEDGRIYLHGVWDLDSESARHARMTQDFQDYVAIRYRAASVHVVLRPEGSEPFVVVVTLDDQPVPSSARGDDVRVDAEGNTYFQVDSPRLYNVIRSPEADTHELELRVNATDFVLYTFTFGA